MNPWNAPNRKSLPFSFLGYLNFFFENMKKAPIKKAVRNTLKNERLEGPMFFPKRTRIGIMLAIHAAIGLAHKLTS